MFMKLDWRFLKNLESRGVWHAILGGWTNDTNEAMYARVGEAPDLSCVWKVLLHRAKSKRA